jgi:hypothetical protein
VILEFATLGEFINLPGGIAKSRALYAKNSILILLAIEFVKTKSAHTYSVGMLIKNKDKKCFPV